MGAICISVKHSTKPDNYDLEFIKGGSSKIGSTGYLLEHSTQSIKYKYKIHVPPTSNQSSDDILMALKEAYLNKEMKEMNLYDFNISDLCNYDMLEWNIEGAKGIIVTEMHVASVHPKAIALEEEKQKIRRYIALQLLIPHFEKKQDTPIIIDAHAHLWAKQDTVWNGKKISPLPNGRSMFLGEEVQMCPPFMIDGTNTAEVFLSNMNYAQVAASVVTQEFIDGIQNDYYKTVNEKYGNRLMCLCMLDYMNGEFTLPSSQSHDWKGVVIPGHRIYKDGVRMPINSENFMKMFKEMEKRNLILSLCLEDNEQTAEFREVIQECPELKVAIGHFGMPTEETWYDQVRLAENKNVMVESGGITWLYNSEFYPFPTAVKKIKEAADMVGMEKLMWGSDYPRTITAITYKMSYDFVLKTNELTDTEKRLFLGENAKKFYGFGELQVPKHVKNMSE